MEKALMLVEEETPVAEREVLLIEMEKRLVERGYASVAGLAKRMASLCRMGQQAEGGEGVSHARGKASGVINVIDNICLSF